MVKRRNTKLLSVPFQLQLCPFDKTGINARLRARINLEMEEEKNDFQ